MSQSWAGTASCDETLNACDAALKAKQRELDLSDLGIKIRDDARAMDQKEIAELRASSSRTAIYVAITAVVTAVVTAYGVSRATR